MSDKSWPPPQEIEDIFSKEPASWSPEEKDTFLTWLGMDEETWDMYQELPPELQAHVHNTISLLNKIQNENQQ